MQIAPVTTDATPTARPAAPKPTSASAAGFDAMLRGTPLRAGRPAGSDQPGAASGTGEDGSARNDGTAAEFGPGQGGSDATDTGRETQTDVSEGGSGDITLLAVAPEGSEARPTTQAGFPAESHAAAGRTTSGDPGNRVDPSEGRSGPKGAMPPNAGPPPSDRTGGVVGQTSDGGGSGPGDRAILGAGRPSDLTKQGPDRGLSAQPGMPSAEGDEPGGAGVVRTSDRSVIDPSGASARAGSAGREQAPAGLGQASAAAVARNDQKGPRSTVALDPQARPPGQDGNAAQPSTSLARVGDPNRAIPTATPAWHGLDRTSGSAGETKSAARNDRRFVDGPPAANRLTGLSKGQAAAVLTARAMPTRPTATVLSGSPFARQAAIGPVLTGERRSDPLAEASSLAPPGVGAQQPAAAAAPTITTAPQATAVAQQLAAAMITRSNDRIEVSLNPAELGRVRMSIQSQDATLTLVIQVDRPETADLMRRHAETLASEFRQMGYSNLTLDISAGDQGSGRRHRTDADASTTPIEPVPTDAPSVSPPSRAIGPSGGVDLKV